MNQDIFSDREVSFIWFSNPANVANSFLDGRDLKLRLGYKVKFLNIWIGEFQQQIYVQRLELEDAHLGYVESRREQVRQEGQLVMKRKVFETLRLDVFTKWEN